MILTDESIVYQSHSKTEKNVEAQSIFSQTTGDPATERQTEWSVTLVVFTIFIRDISYGLFAP